MGELRKPYNTVRHGGFAITDLVPRGRVPDEVKRVSDTEVYAIYSDIDPEKKKVKYKQTFKAEKVTGKDDMRKNVTETIEKSVDEGKTWKKIYG